MAAERASFPVRLMARLPGVSASGFYSWASSHGSTEPPDGPWGPLRAEVMWLWLASGRRWGARTIRSQHSAAPSPRRRSTARGSVCLVKPDFRL